VVLRGVRFGLFALVALLLLLLMVVAFAPAKWATQALQERSGGTLVFSEVRGRWWNGQARLALASGAEKPVLLPGIITWRAAPGALFSGKLAVQLSAPALSAQAFDVSVVRAAGGLRVEAQAWRAQLPMAVFQGLGAPWNTLGLTGVMQWAAGPMSFESSAARAGMLAGASGVLTLTEMASLVSPLKPLGTYSINWQSTSAEVSFNLSTVRGPLLLDARGAVVGSKLRVSGTAKAEPSAVSALANLLGIIGRRTGGTAPAEGGQVAFQFG
jgi:general secretion pathway protein N